MYNDPQTEESVTAHWTTATQEEDKAEPKIHPQSSV